LALIPTHAAFPDLIEILIAARLTGAAIDD